MKLEVLNRAGLPEGLDWVASHTARWGSFKLEIKKLPTEAILSRFPYRSVSSAPPPPPPGLSPSKILDPPLGTSKNHEQTKMTPV